MKKNVMMRIASVLMIAVLLTTCVISGTFAKYTSTASGTGSAVIASWNVTVDDEAFSDTMSFNLFETVYENAAGTSVDADVKTGFIAPGTKGAFSFVVKNDSDVTAKFKIEHNAADILGDAGLSMIEFYDFTVSGDGEKEIVDENETGYVIVESGKSATIAFSWSWAFETSTSLNTVETEMAKEALNNRTFTVTATINAEQVD